MAQYKITFNKKVCDGTGVCASICPDNWVLVENSKGDKKARPKKWIISEKELYSNEQAADSCPTEAITIEKMKKRGAALREESFEEDDFMDF